MSDIHFDNFGLIRFLARPVSGVVGFFSLCCVCAVPCSILVTYHNDNMGKDSSKNDISAWYNYYAGHTVEQRLESLQSRAEEMILGFQKDVTGVLLSSILFEKTLGAIASLVPTVKEGRSGENDWFDLLTKFGVDEAALTTNTLKFKFPLPDSELSWRQNDNVDTEIQLSNVNALRWFVDFAYGIRCMIVHGQCDATLGRGAMGKSILEHFRPTDEGITATDPEHIETFLEDILKASRHALFHREMYKPHTTTCRTLQNFHQEAIGYVVNKVKNSQKNSLKGECAPTKASPQFSDNEVSNIKNWMYPPLIHRYNCTCGHVKKKPRSKYEWLLEEEPPFISNDQLQVCRLHAFNERHLASLLRENKVKVEDCRLASCVLQGSTGNVALAVKLGGFSLGDKIGNDIAKRESAENILKNKRTRGANADRFALHFGKVGSQISLTSGTTILLVKQARTVRATGGHQLLSKAAQQPSFMDVMDIPGGKRRLGESVDDACDRHWRYEVIRHGIELIFEFQDEIPTSEMIIRFGHGFRSDEVYEQVEYLGCLQECQELLVHAFGCSCFPGSPCKREPKKGEWVIQGYVKQGGMTMQKWYKVDAEDLPNMSDGGVGEGQLSGILSTNGNFDRCSMASCSKGDIAFAVIIENCPTADSIPGVNCIVVRVEQMMESSVGPSAHCFELNVHKIADALNWDINTLLKAYIIVERAGADKYKIPATKRRPNEDSSQACGRMLPFVNEGKCRHAHDSILKILPQFEPNFLMRKSPTIQMRIEVYDGHDVWEAPDRNTYCIPSE